MLKTRVIPCLLLRNRGLVKTVRFKDAMYVGDPINTVRIFNEKLVDELIFVDITASVEGSRPQFKLIEEIATECFMPFAYGGGVRDFADAKRLFSVGAEKLAVNTFFHERPEFVTRLSDHFGAQSVIVSLDVKRNFLGRYSVWSKGGRQNTGMDPVRCAVQAAQAGAGEVLLTSIDRDGTFQGYDLELIRSVAREVDLPVIASGGAGKVEDFGRAVKEAGAAAVAAGSLVVYQGRHRAVLINFPTPSELASVLE